VASCSHGVRTERACLADEDAGSDREHERREKEAEAHDDDRGDEWLRRLSMFNGFAVGIIGEDRQDYNSQIINYLNIYEVFR